MCVCVYFLYNYILYCSIICLDFINFLLGTWWNSWQSTNSYFFVYHGYLFLFVQEDNCRMFPTHNVYSLLLFACWIVRLSGVILLARKDFLQGLFEVWKNMYNWLTVVSIGFPCIIFRHMLGRSLYLMCLNYNLRITLVKHQREA